MQHEFRAHSVPKPQRTPSRLPTNSPTAASAHRANRPSTHTQGARARHDRGHNAATRAPWLAQWRARVPSRALTSLDQMVPTLCLVEGRIAYSLLQSYTREDSMRRG